MHDFQKKPTEKQELTISKCLEISYPPYYQINRAKQYCYPDNIEITDSGVNMDLISLLNHMVQRILTIIDKTGLQNLQ